MALSNVTLPYVMALANKGFAKACHDNDALAKGVNTAQGHVTYKAVADALGYNFVELSSLIN